MQIASVKNADNIIYFTNDSGVYGYFDPSKVIPESEQATRTYVCGSEDQQQIVEAFIDTKVSNSEKYVFNYSNYVEDTGLTSYVYTYSIDGINTADYIFVMVNNANEIVSYGLPNEDAFEDVDLSIVNWEEMDVELEQYLIENEISEYQVTNQCLVWENDILSIRYTISYNIDGQFECMDDVNIPLEGCN